MKIILNGGLKILSSNKVMALDWDLDDGSEPNDYGSGVKKTFLRNRDDVLTKIINSELYKLYGFRLYWTPNGVRGFITSQNIRVGAKSSRIMRCLCCDEAYVEMTAQWDTFNVRISKKKDRKNDYVAAFWCNIGSHAMTPEAEMYVKVHDELCQLNRGDVGIPEELGLKNSPGQLMAGSYY